MLFTVNQNKKAGPEIVFHKILLKHMIFAYHNWNVIGIKDLKKTQKKASKTENSFCNQIVCFDSQCVAEATTKKNFCNKQIKAKKRENQLPCVLAWSFNNYVDRILAFFDPHPPARTVFINLSVDKNKHFLTPSPHLILST
jgi:hypothetical protein